METSRPGEHVLYGYKGSGSAAIEAALMMAEVPFRKVNAASWDAASEIEALRRVNPLLQIPALRWPDGTTMSESAAILIELGLRHPASQLLPEAPAERARAIRGLVYLAANCYSAIGVIDFPERWITGPDDGATERVRQGARMRLHALWDNFAATFVPNPFLNGAQPGALDLLACVVSKWSGTRAHLKATHPEWYPVLEHIEQHPSIAPIFAQHWP